MLSGVTKSLIVFGTTVLSVSLLTACAYLSSEPPPTSYSYPVSTAIIPESDLESLLASDDTTETSEETSETSFTVETEAYENPLADYSIQNSNYSFEAYCIVYPYDYKVDIRYGFDNEYTLSLLRDYVYEATGIQDDTITLSDVGYFQYTGYFNGNYSSFKFSTYPDMVETPLYIEAIRAILSSEGLRFGIDEIPASYIAERFPRYYYDSLEFNKFNKCCVEEVTEPIADPLTLNSIFEAPSVMDKDYDLFRACLIYNSCRSSYMYDNPYGTAPIQQVRDAVTGKNVLIPTESQIEELQQDINSISGCENIDIFTPETPEDYYATYGYYPDDVVNDIYYYNTPEGFAEYYYSLPEADQNELYAPILFN